MAISSYKVFLMKRTSSTYSKLVDIKDFPDLGSDPESLDTTTLSDYMHTYIPGIKDTGGALTFTCNYDLTDYKALLELEESEEEYAVWFGGSENETTHVVTPTGSNGKWTFKGTLSVYPLGKGVNEVVEMQVSIMPSTVVAFDSSAAG